MTDADPRDDVPDSAAEREGIVDQQDATLAAIEESEHRDDDPTKDESPNS